MTQQWFSTVPPFVINACVCVCVFVLRPSFVRRLLYASIGKMVWPPPIVLVTQVCGDTMGCHLVIVSRCIFLFQNCIVGNQYFLFLVKHFESQAVRRAITSGRKYELIIDHFKPIHSKVQFRRKWSQPLISSSDCVSMALSSTTRFADFDDHLYKLFSSIDYHEPEMTHAWEFYNALQRGSDLFFFELKWIWWSLNLKKSKPKICSRFWIFIWFWTPFSLKPWFQKFNEFFLESTSVPHRALMLGT